VLGRPVSSRYNQTKHFQHGVDVSSTSHRALC